MTLKRNETLLKNTVDHCQSPVYQECLDGKKMVFKATVVLVEVVVESCMESIWLRITTNFDFVFINECA